MKQAMETGASVFVEISLPHICFNDEEVAYGKAQC
jgi:hypothetical protein